MLVLRGLIPHRTTPCGPDTPLNKVLGGTPRIKILWGIKPQGATFIYKYFREFETELKNILGGEFGDYMGSIRGEKGRKSRSTVPLKYLLGDYKGLCVLSVETTTINEAYTYFRPSL